MRARIVVVAILVLLEECAPNGALLHSRSAESRSFAGIWDVELQITQPGAADSARQLRTLLGRLSLGPPTEGAPTTGANDLVGKVEFDFRKLLASPPRNSWVTASVLAAGDSIRLDIGYCEVRETGTVTCVMDGGALRLRGAIRGDSVEGTWFQEYYCCGSAGKFVMRRRLGISPAPPNDR